MIDVKHIFHPWITSDHEFILYSMLHIDGVLLRAHIFNLELVRELELHDFISLRGGNMEFRPQGLKYCKKWLEKSEINAS
jgi:hypothetical protein